MYSGIIAYSICDIAISRELKAAYLCNIRLRQLKEDPKRYEKEFINLVALLTSATISAQNGGTIMKKYENQLPQAGRGNVHVAYQGKAIDQMIYDFMEEQGIPGMTLAIVQAPYIPRVAGYGVTDLEKGNLAAAKTLWPIGPISQGYAAVAVMQLYEKGKLDLNDPIGKYLKDIPETGNRSVSFS